MAETQEHREQPRRGREEVDAPWSQIWHLPVLLLGLGLFILGLWVMKPTPETHDFSEALNDVAVYLGPAGNLPAAEAKLEEIGQHIEQADRHSRSRYWQYWGDVAYGMLHRRLPDAPWRESARETHQTIVRYYTLADEYGQAIDRELDTMSLRRFAETLSAMGRLPQAVALVDRLGADPAHHRYEVLRQMIERQRELGPADAVAVLSGEADALTPLLSRFEQAVRQEQDEARRRRQQIWLEHVRAERRLEAGDASGAIDHLVVQIPRLGRPGPDLAPLHVLLGRAYQQEGADGLDEALEAYARASELVRRETANPLWARILVGLGQIALAQHEAELALEYFGRAAREFPSEAVYIDALIGEADSHARLGAYAQAAELFSRAVAQLVERAPSWDPRRTELSQTVTAHVGRLADQQRHHDALHLLEVLVPMYGQDLPDRLLLDFARTHLALAEQRLASGQSDDPSVRRLSGEALRLANQEAAIHFEAAGDFFLRHALRMSIEDDEAHGQSLWAAAEAYDQAQLWKRAIEVYDQFIATRQTDPLYLRAVHRLGRAYLSDGQYQQAVDRFRELTSEHPRSPETYQSLTPLAQALMALDRLDEAERTLLSVVSDHEAIRPDSSEYRSALVELGRLYYRQGESDPSRYVQAIERLSEAVERYGHMREGPTLRYLLADAYRKSVPALDQEITRRQSPGHRMELQQERDDRLRQAQIYYNQTLHELEAMPEDSLSPLERVYLRNAYFYQADAVFDRGQFESAIDLYSQAARHWRSEPASLVALVQIVNAHCELGQFHQAQIANERAQAHLAQIPDEAFDDHELLPMSRRHWQDWLKWTSRQDLFEPAHYGEQPGSPQTQR